jgi:hypothetical protein
VDVRKLRLDVKPAAVKIERTARAVSWPPDVLDGRPLSSPGRAPPKKIKTLSMGQAPKTPNISAFFTCAVLEKHFNSSQVERLLINTTTINHVQEGH